MKYRSRNHGLIWGVILDFIGIAAFCTLIAIILFAFGRPSQAETQFRLGATLGSYHPQHASEYEQFNPGLNIGVTFRADKALQYGFQAGAYSNSYGERTIYGLAFADTRLFDIGQIEIRGGGFAGMFEYAEFAPKAAARGWPTMGDFILVVGPHVKARFNNGVDLNVGFIPLYTNKTSGVFTLSVSIPIGGN